MKKRIQLFLQLRSYSAVARAEGVDPASIRKQMQNIKHEEVQELVQRISHRQYTNCEMCGRPKERVPIFAKGKCQACYKYFRREHFVVRKRRIN